MTINILYTSLFRFQHPGVDIYFLFIPGPIEFCECFPCIFQLLYPSLPQFFYKPFLEL